MRIIFMGTPDFAVPSLDILYKNGYDIAAVITSTDKRGGRGGKQLLQSAVKKYAVANGLKVLQPPNLKNREFQEELKSLKADIQVVVAFRMLPKSVWNMPPLGTLNVHGSLLPKYRGAAPINWAIINGEKTTGLTTFFLKHEIDTGDLLLRSEVEISNTDTAGSLHDKMMASGAELLLRSIQAVERGDYVLKSQDNSAVSKAPKIHRDTCEIDFNQPTKKVYNFVRGLSPYPAAWTTKDDKQVKIFDSEPIYIQASEAPGTWVIEGKDLLKIATADGYLQVNGLQMAGKRRMNTKDFLNGYLS